MREHSRYTCLWVVALAVLALAGCNKSYVFEPEDITAIAQVGVGLTPQEGITKIHEALMEKYPEKIRKDFEWHFNRTGGTLGEMTILYASTKEYVLIFGTPIFAEGFSGRYKKMDVYDNMFSGEMWTYLEGQTDKTIYKPGDCAILNRGEGKGYFMVPDTWMLEYARGDIPAALPIGLFAPVSVTADYQNMWDVLMDYAGLVFRAIFNIAA